MIITSEHLKKKGTIEKVHKREKWIVFMMIWNGALVLLIGVLGMYGT